MSVKISNLVFIGADRWDRFTYQERETRKCYCFVSRLYDGETDEEAMAMLKDAQKVGAGIYIKSPTTDPEGEPSHAVPIED